MHDDEQAIRQLVDTWMAATKAGDAKAVLELMADDVVFLVPGAPPFGKARFAEAATARAGAETTFEGTSEIQEIQVFGDWAFMRTQLTVATAQPGKPAATRAGTTLSILVKRDGKWLLARDANLLAPVAQAAGSS
ncbi:SgcJ/EcaC family oxidoreductase [Lysobacter niabensis]|uniref:SgcJ/EcaC family oxidoreductase n=1 Tax=Agrilutibacter niabensis TaxID=380628 RepID=UPI003617C378